MTRTAETARFRLGIKQPPIITDRCDAHIVTSEYRRNQWRLAKWRHRLDMQQRGKMPLVEIWRA